MSDQIHIKQAVKPKWFRRCIICILALLLIVTFLVVFTGIFIKTNSGARFIESQINNRSYGQIERIEILGLSGDPLNIFTVKSVKVFDKDGLWLKADNITIEWNPWALRRRLLDFKSARAQTIAIMRQPVLNAPAPTPVSSDKRPYSISLNKGAVEAFKLDEIVLGQSAILALEGQLNTNNNGDITARLHGLQTDKQGDRLTLDLIRKESGALSGAFDLTGVANGTLAKIFQAPHGTDVIGKGKINGTVETGQGDFLIRFNGTPKLTVKSHWNPKKAQLSAILQTENWPLFDRSRTGLGNRLDIDAALNRHSQPSDYHINLTAKTFYADAKGYWNPEDGALPKDVNVLLRSDNLGAILPQSEGFEIGAGQIDGKIMRLPHYMFSGDIRFDALQTPYGQAASISGPLTFRQEAETQYSLEGDWIFDTIRLVDTVPIKMAPQTYLKATAKIDTQTTTIKDIKLALRTGESRLNVTGIADYGAPNYAFAGETYIRMEAIGRVPSGELQSEFKVNQTVGSGLALIVSGAFKPNRLKISSLDPLIKDGVNFEMDVIADNQDIIIRNIALKSSNIEAVLKGNVADELDIEGEIRAASKLTYQAIELSGQKTARFKLTGNITDPNLRLDSTIDTADYKGKAISDIRLRADITDVLKAPNGPVRLTANTEQGALDVSANFASTNQTYAARDIQLSLGKLSAFGHLSKPLTAPATGQFSLRLPRNGDPFVSKNIKADIKLMPNGDVQGLSIDVDIKNMAYQAWMFDEFKLTAKGTVLSLSGSLNAKGNQQRPVLQRPFSTVTPFIFTQADKGSFQVDIRPDVTYGNITIDSLAPIIARYQMGDIFVNAPLKLAGEPFTVAYERQSDLEKFTLKTLDLPMTLIPMPESLANTRGQIGADITLSNSAGRSTILGNATVSLKDWRGNESASGSGLSGDLGFKIANENLLWDLNALSKSGFSAKSDGVIKLIQAPTLSGLRVDMNAPVSGRFIADGQAVPLLGLVTPSDSKPSGQLKAELNLSGSVSKPNIEGRVSAQALRMEAPTLGTQLRKGRFTADFTNDTINVTDVFIADRDNGVITGQGQFRLGELGRPIGGLTLKANNFRALDRKDYEGTVTGDLSYISTQKQATLSGDITLKKAEVKQFVQGKTSVVEIPVEEINKPESSPVTDVKVPTTPLNLDIILRAPRRIFVRSQGLDVELSVAANVKGTLSSTEIFGKANVLRGSYTIAGKSLNFETGGIKFDGDLGEAKLNLIANTETRNLSAQLIVSGTVAKPEIELLSAPERPQDEILSALLFGRAATDLTVLEAAQLAGALAQFSGAGGNFDLIGGLRDALGVGQLSFGLDPNGVAQITSGRYLAKNVYLQVFSGGNTGQTGALIDWEIKKNISLSSKIQADNDQSFSLKWKKDF